MCTTRNGRNQQTNFMNEKKEEMYRELADRYFRNTCTAGEAKEVLEWFDTPEGKAYLEERLDSDIEEGEEADDDKVRLLTPDLDSRRLYSAIRMRIHAGTGSSFRAGRERRLRMVWRAAAAVLVILTASLFYQAVQQDAAEMVADQIQEAYELRSGDEQREVTLADGTVIRLNRHSTLTVLEGYMHAERTVRLEGEAFFDVAHLPDKPFRVQVGGARVQVLGTSFNIKAAGIPGSDVQLAVIEGSVSFGGDTPANGEEAVILSGGEFAYLDASGRIEVEDFGVENYLVWMSGRIVFDGLPLERICVQLQRLYGSACEFEEETIGGMRLTADFSDDSLEKTLSVISLSLELDYDLTGDGRIVWSR